MKWIFSLHINFTVQYVNKSIVNVKVLPRLDYQPLFEGRPDTRERRKSSLSSPKQKFSHAFGAENYLIFVKKWSGGWDKIYRSISSCDVVLWTELS